MDWLLESDPAIRWQVMRDLTDAPAADVAAERSKVATTGWGAELLARQTDDGHWGGAADAQSWPASREWHALTALALLRDFGLDPESAEARGAVELTAEKVTWQWWDNHPFFVGEVEPCINGRVVAIGAYFGQDVELLLNRLLGEQMADGGWNCEQENGATIGSFATTINVLEGLLEVERAGGSTPALTSAHERGRAYLLERQLFRRKTTGEVADPAFTQLSFPPAWHYDVLRALDYLSAADVQPDARIAEAIGVIESKRDVDGRLPLEVAHDDNLDFEMGERVGQPSRWNTLRALRVLRWYDRCR